MSIFYEGYNTKRQIVWAWYTDWHQKFIAKSSDWRGSKYDLKEGFSFAKSRKVISSRRKELAKLGKGNKPNAARV